MDTYQIIRDAIIKRRQIVANYKGYDREMCPHVLGTKKGRYQALFYQFAGHSSSGPIVSGSRNNWRCLFLEELSNVRARDGEWYTSENHSRPQTCVDAIDVEVT